MNAVNIASFGLKCDSPGCEYREAVPFEKYAEYLDKPCPVCGAPLLNEKDCAAIRLLMACADWTNAIVGEVPEGSDRVLLKIKTDGSGSIDIITDTPQ